MLLCAASCARGQGILGVSRKEAAERLKNGDAAFILEAELPSGIQGALRRLRPLGRVYPGAYFYAGLLTEGKSRESAAGTDGPNPASGNHVETSALLFTLALESRSPAARGAAAEKLLVPCLETENTAFIEEIKKRLKKDESGAALNLLYACLYRLSRFEELVELKSGDEAGGASSWGKILPLFASLNKTDDRRPDGENQKNARSIRDFFFDNPVDASWKWALEEIKRIDADFFNPAEGALVSGRAAVANYEYGQGLLFFRETPEADEADARENYFFTYPELASDLGRAFQFAPGAPEEGASLFAGWIAQSRGGVSAPVLYRLLYFAGRIERQRGRYEASSRFFREALEAAPDKLQSDACVWYILMNALADNPDDAAGLAREFIPRMSSPPYFDDFMDRLSRYLAASGRWETVEEIFGVLKANHNSAAAMYGWIAGRAAEEGLLKTQRPPAEFFAAALEEKSAPVYYRAMSAAKLKNEFLPFDEEGNSENENKTLPEEADKARFLLNFFELGCGDFVLPYIRNAEKDLPVSELRKLAKALAEYGSRGESLGLVSRYMARENYEPVREDFLLCYPRHFPELAERRAKEAGFGPEILFGIIRTESAFMSGVVSRSGAVGLGQLLPSTALDMAGRIARSGGEDYRNGGGVDLRAPEINIHISAYYLRYLADYLGDPMTALLAYNGGLGRVRRWRRAASALPEDLFLETVEFPETREYGRRVLAAAAMYGLLYYGLDTKTVIADIYREELFQY